MKGSGQNQMDESSDGISYGMSHTVNVYWKQASDMVRSMLVMVGSRVGVEDSRRIRTRDFSKLDLESNENSSCYSTGRIHMFLSNYFP